MEPDLEKYRRYVAHFDLTQSEKDELIHFIYRSMGGFVDRAFGDDPVQQCLAARKTKSAPGNGAMIELSKQEYQTTRLTPTFEKEKGTP